MDYYLLYIILPLYIVIVIFFNLLQSFFIFAMSRFSSLWNWFVFLFVLNFTFFIICLISVSKLVRSSTSGGVLRDLNPKLLSNENGNYLTHPVRAKEEDKENGTHGTILMNGRHKINLNIESRYLMPFPLIAFFPVKRWCLANLIPLIEACNRNFKFP